MTTEWKGWNALLAFVPPWAHLVCATEHDLEHTLRAPAPPTAERTALRILRGTRCETKRGMMQEWGAALQFPYYFGENWDSFEECLNDLSWLPARGYIFAVTHTDRMLHDTQEFTTALHILDAAAKRWAVGQTTHPGSTAAPMPFHVVFQCDPTHEAATRVRLRAAGVTPETMHLP